MDQHLLQVAGGQKPADLVITNGQIVNVFSGEIYPGGVAVAGDRIAAVGDVDYAIGKDTKIIDAGGKYITPGFIEGHIHPESSNLSMTRFAEVVLCHGTTSVYTDIHEIGVVGGMPAMDAALDEGRQTPLKYLFVMPSHVPFSPGLETSGGSVDSKVIAEALKRDDVVGISEVVSAYVGMNLPDLMQSIDLTRKAHKVLAGHGPDTVGPAWNLFAATGIANDHEGLSLEDVLLRVRSGVAAQLRHNLIVPTLPALIKAITEAHINTRLLSLATDDTSAISLVNDGHLDYLARLAISLGVDFVTAIQMVTLNAADAYQNREIGALAPGRYADINLLEGMQDFKVTLTVANGKVVAQDGKLSQSIPVAKHAAVLLNTFHVKGKIAAKDLLIAAKPGQEKVKVRYMRTLPWIPITEGGEAELAVKDGYIVADTEQDILPIAVIERHHATGNIGKAFIAGFGLKRGAMASSIAHDNHNIVVMGVDAEDMAVAAQRVIDLGGGIVLVEAGKVIGEIAFPIAGLLTDLDAWTLAKERQALLERSFALGCAVPEPFMFFSFITLAAIPSFAITDKGYVDVLQQKLIDPVIA